MVIQFTLLELMIFLVCILGIAAEIFLLPILWNIKKITGILRPIVEANQELIKKSVKTMPVIFENAGQISSNVKETTDKLKVSIPIVMKQVESTAIVAKESIELAGAVIENVSSGIIDTDDDQKKDPPGFMNYLHSIEEILQIIYRTFFAGKEK